MRRLLLVSAALGAILVGVALYRPQPAQAVVLKGYGAELNSTTTDVEQGALSGVPTISTTRVRSGTYSYRIGSMDSAARQGFRDQFISADTTNAHTFTLWVNWDTLPSAENRFITLETSGLSNRISVRWNTDATIELRDEDGLIGDGSTVLSTNVWYKVQIETDLSGAGSTDIVKLYINDSVEVSSTTRNLSSGFSILRWGGNLAAEANTAGIWYFDDIIINDTTGSTWNGVPTEDSHLVVARPNADGDNAMGSNSGGTECPEQEPPITSICQIDEVTPDDASTYYILDVDNDIIDVNVTSSSSLGIDSYDTIDFIQVGVRYAAASAASTTFNVRLKSAASGTVSSGAAISTSSTTWFSNINSVPHNYQLTSYTDPTTSVAWTPTGTNSVDNMQIGAISTDATPDTWISTLYAYIAYSDGAAPGGRRVMIISRNNERLPFT